MIVFQAHLEVVAIYKRTPRQQKFSNANVALLGCQMQRGSTVLQHMKATSTMCPQKLLLPILKHLVVGDRILNASLGNNVVLHEIRFRAQ